MKKKKIQIIVILLCGVVFLSGCGILAYLIEPFIPDEVIDPKFPTEDKKVIVIPFKDDVFTYYESDWGKLLATAIVRNIVKNNEDFGEIKDIFEDPKLKKYFSYHVDEISWAEVAKKAKVDYVLYGTIEEFHLRQRKQVGFKQGKAKVFMYVYDVKKDRTIFKNSYTILYPKQISTDPFLEDSYILKGLIQTMAYKIGREFYYYPKQDPF